MRPLQQGTAIKKKQVPVHYHFVETMNIDMKPVREQITQATSI